MNTEYDNPIQPFPAMPAQVNPIQFGNHTSDNIASMRWESDPLVISLRIRLGAYTPQAQGGGVTQLVRAKDVKPMVNDIGIDRFVALIQGVINPVSSLSNLDDDEANTLIRQIMHDCIFEIAYNKDRFEIHAGDMRTITSIIKSLVFFQIKRSVSGHEAKNFRTQTFEQTMNQSMNAPAQNNGSLLNPFRWGKK